MSLGNCAQPGMFEYTVLRPLSPMKKSLHKQIDEYAENSDGCQNFASAINNGKF